MVRELDNTRAAPNLSFGVSADTRSVAQRAARRLVISIHAFCLHCRNTLSYLRHTLKVDSVGIISVSLTDSEKMARHLQRRFGEEAALIALGMADGFAMSGDDRQYQQWIAVVGYIEGLHPKRADNQSPLCPMKGLDA